MGAVNNGLEAALHVTARVQAGSKIEISAPELKEGQDVENFLIPRSPKTESGRSVLEFLDSLPPGPRSAPTWEDLDRQFQSERDAWDR
jgi:hypothetical protein